MSPMDPMQRDHTEHQDFPWTINVADHPPRTESAQYKASRKLMRTLVATTDGEWPFVPGPGSAGYEDHHGGGVWVSDHDGWLCVLLPLGIEWSAQFCAAPEKVDRIRRCAARVVSAFPDTLPGYAALGYDDGERLLGTPIRTAGQVAEWTDSIFNASVPLPRGPHSGVLPNAAGYHHYPKPIVDIDHFRRDDFELFVTDERGLPVVVVPLAPRGSGDGRVRVLAAHAASSYAERLVSPMARAPEQEWDGAVLQPDDPLAREAFRHQQD
ncbi:DUF6424 family protein [Streptomyces sp. NBC_01537]|uniref:DUF6424 family protein n=1 Tax=Streptomyces sp. NBC_01537 TaxID=2903896 RepID=UPI003868E5EC